MKSIAQQFEWLVLVTMVSFMAACLQFPTLGHGAEKEGGGAFVDEVRGKGAGGSSARPDSPREKLKPYLTEVKAACRSFAREHCRQGAMAAEGGPPPIVSCLLEKKPQTSPECQRALTKFKDALDEAKKQKQGN